MKSLQYTFVLAFILALSSCGNNAGNRAAASKEIDVTPVVQDLSVLEDWTESHHNPIEVFRSNAMKQAKETISLDGSNIAQALYKAKSFEYCIITADNHTIVAITNLEDCQQSGSWDACMPMGEGYIQRGSLQATKDYINNIIGKPGLQERMMFLF